MHTCSDIPFLLFFRKDSLFVCLFLIILSFFPNMSSSCLSCSHVISPCLCPCVMWEEQGQDQGRSWGTGTWGRAGRGRTHVTAVCHVFLAHKWQPSTKACLCHDSFIFLWYSSHYRRYTSMTFLTFFLIIGNNNTCCSVCCCGGAMSCWPSNSPARMMIFSQPQVNNT